MRLLLPFVLLALPACNSGSDTANEQASREYNEQRIGKTAAEPSRSAGEAAAYGGGGVPAGAARPLGSEAGEIGVAGDEGRAGPAKPDAQTSSSTAQLVAPAAPAGAVSRNGRELVQTKCSTCHSLDVALAASRSPAGWAEILEVMTGHGMIASEAERRLMKTHLETCCLSSAAP